MSAEEIGTPYVLRMAVAGPNCQTAAGSPGKPVRADHRLSDDNAAPITVMIASDRQALLLAWMPRLMREPGIELHADSLSDPAHLAHSVVQKAPTVLLLDKAMLDRLDGKSIRTISTFCENTRVLLLWDEFSNGLVVDVLRNGFQGFLLTSCLPEVSAKAPNRSAPCPCGRQSRR